MKLSPYGTLYLYVTATGEMPLNLNFGLFKGSTSNRASTSNLGYRKSVSSDEVEPILEKNELQDEGLFSKDLGEPGDTQEIDKKVKVFIEKNFPGSYLMEERPVCISFIVIAQELQRNCLYR